MAINPRLCPCRGCKLRKIGCHGDGKCRNKPTYREWKDSWDAAQNPEMESKKAAELLFDGAEKAIKNSYSKRRK